MLPLLPLPQRRTRALTLPRRQSVAAHADPVRSSEPSFQRLVFRPRGRVRRARAGSRARGCLL
eukprot:2234202-Pleurochrysis_carterae.AAC.1